MKESKFSANKNKIQHMLLCYSPSNFFHMLSVKKGLNHFAFKYLLSLYPPPSDSFLFFPFFHIISIILVLILCTYFKFLVDLILLHRTHISHSHTQEELSNIHMLFYCIGLTSSLTSMFFMANLLQVPK
jgi:hypothetical protein